MSLTRSRLDLIGLTLAGLAAAWTYFVAVTSGGDPFPFVGLLALCGSAFLLGRLAAGVHPLVVPAFVVVAASAVAIRTSDVLSPAPLSGPFGYANAKGAFFLQAAIAGLMLAAMPRPAPIRLLGLTAAIAFGFVPFAAKSLTPAFLVLLLPVAALTVYAWIGARAAVLSFAVLFIVALTATVVVGSVYSPRNRSGLVDRAVDSTLTERRAALWHEALSMMRDHPFTGVGLGRFQALSPTARLDRDARWAHNSFLQQGAETGLVGFFLLGLLFIWAIGSLGSTTPTDALGVLGAVAVAALGIHASVDYVLHFPAVPITAAAMAGAAGTPSLSRLRRPLENHGLTLPLLSRVDE